MSLTTYLDRKFYPSFSNNWDDQLFRKKLLKLTNPQMKCLDFGAGRGKLDQLDLRDVVAHVSGIDPDPIVLKNPLLHDAKILDEETQRVDYPDNTFDLVYADNVFEHLPSPRTTLVELFRVLKPGGRLLAKTPNVWHYMPTIARITPPWFHRFYNSMRGRDGIDTFPTLYRANSKAKLHSAATDIGFQVESIEIIEGRPEYLRLTIPTYLAGIAYERFVNSSQVLESFRCVLYIQMSKPEVTAD